MRRLFALAILACIMVDHSLAQSFQASSSVNQGTHSLLPEGRSSVGQGGQRMGGRSQLVPNPSKQEIDLPAHTTTGSTGGADVAIDEQYWADSFFAALSGGVMALAVDGSDLYVGGGFTNTGMRSVRRLHRPLGWGALAFSWNRIERLGNGSCRERNGRLCRWIFHRCWR